MARFRISFKQWCLDNDRQDLLDRWDYEKNGFGPEDVGYATNTPIYFKCPKGIHESEKKRIYQVTSKNSAQKDFKCKGCLNGHAHNFDDLTGRVFGELTVIKLDEERNRSKPKGNSQTYWICQCSCGKTASVYASALRGGKQVTCGDKSFHHTGENGSNWRGGITPQLLLERTSKRYNEWRDKTYAKDWYTCQCCGDSGWKMEKNAHHILNFSEDEELRYDLDNSILLCAKCHHIKYKGSFHNRFGTRDNNESQLEEYINDKRKELGIHIPFSMAEYRKGNILKPGDVEKAKDENVNDADAWEFLPVRNIKNVSDENLTKNGFVKIKPKYRVKED